MKRVQYNKINGTYVLRLTSDELYIIQRGLSYLPQINSVIGLRDDIDKEKLAYTIKRAKQ